MTDRRGRTLIAVTVGALVLVVLGLTLRSRADSAPEVAAATSSASPTADVPPVIVPGRPGESAAVRPAQEVRDASPPRYNSLDVWFVRMMIPHHQQALEMAALAESRAADPRVRAVADRIRAAQEPEIGLMRGWLAARGLPAEVPGHDHGTMRGMQSPEAMRGLAAARGADFDRLFVQMMTAHHQGAVAMATDLLKVGADLTMSEFANSVATEQGVEIDRMHELLAR
ncbi:DUF305 domain-containing protein [Micromonospora sp. 4G57]|uniref:DUF305 domain-containing protein n=1 Tax=Micromonospora sicca TaxID=2202420 RepID=A0ABU5J718_9ACTN|nr:MULTISPECIES: DUF305 domain-containing protein [unclassified Micromonospora]MDZ5442959.1 DUF305 domain-containing protein [Micromonospora sp. 4G57]MDZ5488330.1 DUF305 domain-containing protein [Micromonospora sp. 4G53]